VIILTLPPTPLSPTQILCHLPLNTSPPSGLPNPSPAATKLNGGFPILILPTLPQMLLSLLCLLCLRPIHHLPSMIPNHNQNNFFALTTLLYAVLLLPYNLMHPSPASNNDAITIILFQCPQICHPYYYAKPLARHISKIPYFVPDFFFHHSVGCLSFSLVCSLCCLASQPF
jgi:hypothetical protein